MSVPLIDIYTDGSSKANGKPECIAGWAMVIPDFNGKMFVRYGHLPAPSSNNKGEIMGVLYAMHLFSKQDRFQIRVFSDSQYVVKSVTEWRKKWAAEGYEGVKNKHLLMPLFDAYDRSPRRPFLQWVKGHNGNPGNEAADLWCARGKMQEIHHIKSDTQDIQYIPHENLPFSSLEPA